jgi:hypothetical protein
MLSKDIFLWYQLLKRKDRLNPAVYVLQCRRAAAFRLRKLCRYLEPTFSKQPKSADLDPILYNAQKKPLKKK